MMGKVVFKLPTTTTSSVPLLLLLAGVALVTWTPQGVEGQANVDQSMTFWKLAEADKIINLANYFATHDDVLRKVLNIAESLKWMEMGTNGNAMGDAAMPALLDALPEVFNSSVLKLAFYVAFDEISRAMPTDRVSRESLFNMTVEKTGPFNVSVFSPAFNETMQKLTTQYIRQHANWRRAVNRFLAQMSARDVLYETSPQRATVDPQCYSDTTDFIDAVIGATVIQGNMSGVDSVDLKHYGWALKMLDSFGKISGGVMKGAVHYVGSFDECTSVHAYMPKNSSLLLGRRPHNYVTEFDTRFCRVTFDLPDAVIDSFGVNTRGITVRLHWGMCFPDSCHSDDVAAMFRLGMLEQYKIGVHTVYCVEDQDVGDDTSAIVAIVILTLLGGAVVICTVLETLIQFYNNNCVSPGNPSLSSIEDPEAFKNPAGPTTTRAVYENLAYQPTEEKGPIMDAPSTSTTQSPASSKAQGGGGGPGVPPNYVPHREGQPTAPSSPHPGTSSSRSPNGGGDGGGGELKRRSPPPSYSPRVETGSSGNETSVPKIVKAFSVLSNMPKILSGKKSANAIHCLHGVRFFSMLWIILGHTYNYGLLSVVDNPTTINLVDADSIFRRFTFQAVMAGGFTVDTFFVLSGLLVTYLTLKDMDKSKKGISYWVMFYVHRFWRLTPVYMIVLMVFCCLHTFLGGGPLWPQVLDTAANCKDHWWTNLLYVNNLVHVDNMCMGWTWYLANDMQFYWISPIFLFPLFYLAPLGVAMVLMLMGMGISLAFYFEHKNGGDLVSMHEDSGYWDEVYITPWCRVAAYTVGMLLGFVFYKFKKTTLKLSTAVIGWLVTWGVGLFLCYITYTKNKAGGEDWTVWEYSAYEAFGRPAWALCVAWIIFACHNNRGGWINTILSWEGFLPVSRLTYAAYLVHPVIMMLHVFSRKTLFYIDDYNMAYLYMGHTVTAYLTAFVFSLVAEAPALNLEKLVFRLR